MAVPPKLDLKLGPDLATLFAQERPRFSAGEMRRRRGLVEAAMQQAGVDHLVVYAAGFRGGPVHWLCEWPTTTEAVLVFSPGHKDALLIQYYNHVPLARQLTPDADVKWGGASTVVAVISEL